MENFLENLEQNLLDSKVPFCFFYIDDDSIKIFANIDSENDTINILNTLKDYKFVESTLLEDIDPETAERIKETLRVLSKKQGSLNPIVKPISMSNFR